MPTGHLHMNCVMLQACRILVLLLTTLLIGCGEKAYPPVEILYAEFGRLEGFKFPERGAISTGLLEAEGITWPEPLSAELKIFLEKVKQRRKGKGGLPQGVTIEELKEELITSPRPAPPGIAEKLKTIEKKKANKKPLVVRTNVIPLRKGQIYLWCIDLRTNKEQVKFTEQLTLAAAARWNIKGDYHYEVSADKKTINVKREKAPNKARICGSWRVSADDPPGKAFIKITIEDKVEHRFDFEFKKF